MGRKDSVSDFSNKPVFGYKKSPPGDEMSKYAEQLYIKTVPQNVRDFIDMEAKQQGAAKPKDIVAKPNRTA